jgi:hypothetical protein
MAAYGAAHSLVTRVDGGGLGAFEGCDLWLLLQDVAMLVDAF